MPALFTRVRPAQSGWTTKRTIPEFMWGWNCPEKGKDGEPCRIQSEEKRWSDFIVHMRQHREDGQDHEWEVRANLPDPTFVVRRPKRGANRKKRPASSDRVSRSKRPAVETTSAEKEGPAQTKSRSVSPVTPRKSRQEARDERAPKSQYHCR